MKRFLLFILTAAMLFSISACGKIQNSEFSDKKEEEQTVKASPDEPMTGLQLWSFEIGEDGDISAFLEPYKESGLGYVDFGILWSAFEVEKGKYNWTFVDSIVDQIVNAGFSVGATLVLWTNGLSFKDDLELQKTADGEIYTYDDSRKDFPSLASKENLETIYDTISAFAVHFSEKYGDKTVLFRVVTSPFGDSGYSAAADVDYSESAVSAFVSYLSDKYKTTDAFAENYPFSVSSFEDLKNEEIEKLTSTCLYDWKTFKQKTLSDFYKEAVKIFKKADPTCPTELIFGGVEDTKTAVYRGFYDPYTVSENVGADIYSTTWESDIPLDFFVSYLSDTTDGKIGFTVYEEDLTEENRKTFAEETAKISNISRICFDFSEATAENLSLIKTVSENLKAEKTDSREKNSEAIFVNTADMILRNPAKNLYLSLKEQYETVTADGKAATFVTDTKLGELTAESGITAFRTGTSGKNCYFTADAAELLKEKGLPIYCAESGSFDIRAENGSSFDEETAAALKALFKN